MILLPHKLQAYFVNNRCIPIYVPEEEATKWLYNHNKNDAYWAQVWPASVGLCMFLGEHPQYIREKHVLELAAGLGLAGLYAAPTAKHITITDKEPLAEKFVRQSAQHHGFKNVTAKSLNWKDAIKEPLPDVVLLSDVNYEPAVFEELKQVLLFFLRHQVTIVISTPQRLLAKDFIMDLIPYSSLHWNCVVPLYEKETNVSVFVLDKNPGF